MVIINNNHWLRTQTLLLEVFLHVSVRITGNGRTTLICSFIYLSVGDPDPRRHRLPASIPRPAAFFFFCLRSPCISFCLHHSFLSSGYMRWRSRPTGAICRRCREKQGAEHQIHILSILTTRTHTKALGKRTPLSVGLSKTDCSTRVSVEAASRKAGGRRDIHWLFK